MNYKNNTNNTVKENNELKIVIFFVSLIIFIIIIFQIPILFFGLLFIYFKFGLSFWKILNFFWISQAMKNVFGKEYYTSILESRGTKYHQNNILSHHWNIQESDELSDSTDDIYKDNKSYHNINDIIENNRKKEKIIEEKIIREKNKSVLKEKLYQKKVIPQYSQDVKEKSDILSKKHWSNIWKNKWEEKHKFASDFAKKSSHITSSKNYFWNTKWPTIFGDNKSIWDDYDSITTNFSSNNK
jgi:hypothetical protein